MAKLSLSQGGVIRNKGSNAATFTDAKTGKSSYVNSAYVPRAAKTATPSPAPTTPAPTTAPTGPSKALKDMSIALASKPTGAGSETATTDQNQPENPTESPYYSRKPPQQTGAEAYLSGGVFKEPQSEEQIQRQKLRSAQAEIDSINNYGKQLIDEQRTQNANRMRETNAVNVLSGLSGSSEANTATAKTAAQGQKDIQRIQSEIEVKVQGILSDIRQSAAEEARAQKEEARLGAQASVEFQAAQKEKANENAKMLAQSGATIEGFKKTDPEAYAHMVRQVGDEATLKAIFTLNRPVDSIVDKRLEGGKYVIAYQNPLTGKISIETVDTGLPVGYSKTIDAGDRILAIPDDWSGDPSELVTINKGLTPGQSSKLGGGEGGAGGAYGSDLDAIIGATKATITSKFGQQTFENQIARARNEGDKINLVASVVLGKADSATKTDFANQAVGIRQIEKAIALLDQGVQTGVLQNGAQYVYNIAGKDYDPQLAQINQLITSAIQPYRNSVTGAAWGDQEDGEYQMLFGSTKYSPTELRQRLVGVKEILASKSAAALNSYVNPMGLYGNQFERGTLSQSGDLRSRVDAAGFDYDAMKADGLSDEEIEASL